MRHVRTAATLAAGLLIGATARGHRHDAAAPVSVDDMSEEAIGREGSL